jgi:hypothetical protein
MPRRRPESRDVLHGTGTYRRFGLHRHLQVSMPNEREYSTERNRQETGFSTARQPAARLACPPRIAGSPDCPPIQPRLAALHPVTFPERLLLIGTASMQRPETPSTKESDQKSQPRLGPSHPVTWPTRTLLAGKIIMPTWGHTSMRAHTPPPSRQTRCKKKQVERARQIR